MLSIILIGINLKNLKKLGKKILARIHLFAIIRGDSSQFVVK